MKQSITCHETIPDTLKIDYFTQEAAELAAWAVDELPYRRSKASRISKVVLAFNARKKWYQKDKIWCLLRKPPSPPSQFRDGSITDSEGVE